MQQGPSCLCVAVLLLAATQVPWQSLGGVVSAAHAANTALYRKELAEDNIRWDGYAWKYTEKQLADVCAKPGEKVYTFGPDWLAPLDRASAPWRRWASCEPVDGGKRVTLYRTTQTGWEFSYTPDTYVVRGTREYPAN